MTVFGFWWSFAKLYICNIGNSNMLKLATKTETKESLSNPETVGSLPSRTGFKDASDRLAGADADCAGDSRGRS